MAWIYGTNISDQLITDAEIWIEAGYAINERQLYAKRNETSWTATGTARPAAANLRGKLRTSVFSETSGMLRQIRDAIEAARSGSDGGFGFQALAYKSSAFADGYDTFAELYADAMGAGTTWAVGTGSLTGIPIAEASDMFEEITKIIEKLNYWECTYVSSTLLHSKGCGLSKTGTYNTSDAIYAAAVAAGLNVGGEVDKAPYPTAYIRTGYGILDYNLGTDKYIDLAWGEPDMLKFDSNWFSTVTPPRESYKVIGNVVTVAPTLPGTPSTSVADFTQYWRNSTAAEYATPTLTPAGTVEATKSITDTGSTGTVTLDLLANWTLDASNYLRMDQGNVNPWIADPNKYMEAWQVISHFNVHQHYNTTWTFA